MKVFRIASCVGLLVLLLILSTTIYGDEKEQVRVVHFPWLLPLGHYTIYDQDSISGLGLDFFYDYGALKSQGKAKGAVSVRPGEALQLDVDLRWQACQVDLSPLAKLRPDDLYSLKIFGHCLGDGQMIYISGLTYLGALDLHHTGVGDDGLRHLKRLTSLRLLNLNKTRITDAGLVHLRNLTMLQGLSLSTTNLTDAGIEYLKGLTSLQELVITHTRITQEGLVELKKALPDCRITYSKPIER